MDRDSDLLKKILLFSQTLRKRKVGVTVDNTVDVLRGISFIDIRERNDFYHLLKFSFVSRREEMKLFDDLFEQFWSFETGMEPLARKGDESQDFAEEEGEALSPGGQTGGFQIRDWTDQFGEEGSHEVASVAYSPDEILREKNFGNLQTEELKKIKEFVITLSQKLARLLSRRWKRGRRGDRLDLRRSIRHSIKYGGEIVELRMRQSKPKPPELLFLCDVSGSMDIYSQFALLFIYGIQNAYPHCETFVFSTRLSRITPLLKRRGFEEALSLLSRKVLDWSGGTNIGAALHQLRENHCGLLRSGRTFFLIFSDGWDRGDSALLDCEMKNLKKKVRRLIWLNPLKESRYYQPLCRGMATALPYLDDFLPCHNFRSLNNLAHLLA